MTKLQVWPFVAAAILIVGVGALVFLFLQALLLVP
jgi:hypothetical protein